MGARGYVVRGKHRRGWPVFAYDHDGAFGGPSETDIPLHVFPSLDTAAGGRAHMVRCGCTDVAIFRVHDDGAEERLPSYEEALGEIERLRADVAGLRAGLLDAAGQSRRLGAVIADPLAALEAAEHRLLEAGGWTETKQDRWTDRDGEYACCRDALTIERRRLAAKGGA